MNKNQLQRTYTELLLDGIVSFWARQGVDTEQGGVLPALQTVVARRSFGWVW